MYFGLKASVCIIRSEAFAKNLESLKARLPEQWAGATL
jgi:hypothetical protein